MNRLQKISGTPKTSGSPAKSSIPGKTRETIDVGSLTNVNLSVISAEFDNKTLKEVVEDDALERQVTGSDGNSYAKVRSSTGKVFLITRDASSNKLIIKQQ